MAVFLRGRAVGYLVAAAGAILAALAFDDPPLAALGVPFLLVLALGLTLDSGAVRDDVSAEISLKQKTGRVGEPLAVRVVIAAGPPVRHVAATLELPPSLRGGRAPHFLSRLAPGEPAEFELTVTPGAAGETTIGPLLVSVGGPARLLARRSIAPAVSLQVRPREETLRTLIRSSRVRVPAGDQVARRQGEGIELAEVRPETATDRGLRINWRATARRGEPYVTTRHPEQSTDAVILVDTFESREISRVLEVGAALAAGYLARRDRVGFVAFGGVLDWVEAGSGPRQLERIRARLAATAPFFSYAWKTIDRIPPRALPPGALVVAVSPLRDERFTGALGAMRSRGHEVIVVEVATPMRQVSPGDPPEIEAATRWARMEREDLHLLLLERGIPVATLFPGDYVEPVLAGLLQARRRMRPGVRR